MKKFIYILSALFIAVTAIQSNAYATKHTVSVGNFFFNPHNIPNVSAGDTIRWVWQAGDHTTTSSSIPAGAASWDKLINSSNTVYEYKVTEPGTYDYVCTPHAGMGMVGSFTAIASTPTLIVTPPTQQVGVEPGTTIFNIQSNTDWTASSGASWCTVTQAGSGNGILTATYEANPTNLQRMADILVMVSGITQSVTVVQDASTVGIRELASGSVLIYPNPVKSSFHIYSEGFATHPVTVFLFDLNGHKLIERNYSGGADCLVDMGNMPSGIYFVKILSGTDTFTRRIIKTE